MLYSIIKYAKLNQNVNKDIEFLRLQNVHFNCTCIVDKINRFSIAKIDKI